MEYSCLFCIWRYIRFFHRRPELLSAEHVTQVLTHLASTKNVAASTQNVALSALLFLYREVLQTELEGIGENDELLIAQRRCQRKSEWVRIPM